MPQSYTDILVHAIFSTYRREALIDDTLADDLYGYIGGIARNTKATLLAAGGMPDHVHLLLGVHPSMAAADLLRTIKTNTSKWVHEKRGMPEFKWQTGYGAFSVSRSNVEHVKQYIANQKEHHRTMTFQEEFIAFLKKHGVEYDERYIWE
jgi:putative transposase